METELPNLDTVLFAFYGSLRNGEYNHARLLAGNPQVNYRETITLPGYQMYSLGAYPMVIKGADNEQITVDLFEISDKYLIPRIDGMEIGAGYGRTLVTLPSGEKCVLYIGESSSAAYLKSGAVPKVASGDWVSRKK